MLDFKIIYDNKTEEQWIETSPSGKPLLTTPQLNKGTAFTAQERHAFGLQGKLPVRIEILEEQVMRAYLQYQSFDTQVRKNIYLHNLHDTNQVLFYALVSNHLAEMIPTIYTPIVGTRVKEFSREFRHARGLYITYHDQDNLAEILDNRSNPDIDIIVVTDGEGVLGIGDQGVGGMDIPVAKLMMYTLCSGINPIRTLPIMLDVGTNNQQLLDDPLYLGLRSHRIRGKAYDGFMAHFVAAVKQKFPQVFLHWEDFGRETARHNLDLFRNEICSFNDDIQGTGAVTLAAILAAIKVTGTSLPEQRIVVFGAGSAGTGISDQIYAAMLHADLSPEAARAKFWLVDKTGLLTDEFSGLTSAQLPYAKSKKDYHDWQLAKPEFISLAEVVAHVKPTILIGCSSLGGAFTQSIIQTMASHVAHPIILPLSNPTENAEATPEDLLQWTSGRALIATGSPFANVSFDGSDLPIAQCNNALVFPGIGLGVIAVKATAISDNMLMAACMALSECAPCLQGPQLPLLPLIEDAAQTAQKIALAVAREAQRENLATVVGDPANLIQQHIWQPRYLPYRKKRNT